jgi:DNA-binding protein H-NS
MSDENETLALPDVISELRAIEARKAELETLAAEAKKTNLPLIVDGIKSYISDNGFTLDEVLPLLTPNVKRQRSKSTKAKTTRNEGPRPVFTSKLDAANVYVRGVLPAWLRKEMVDAGFNPDDKASRDKYKAEHMISSLPVAPTPEPAPAA